MRLHRVSQWTETKQAWGLLFATALFVLGCALYFQLALGLEPCVKCVYQRLAMLGIGLAAILGYVGHRMASLRGMALLLWLVSAGWGFYIANDHAQMQLAANAFFAVCDAHPSFPSWAPLHEWIPMIFAAPGLCGDIDWQFLGLSMPMWMQIIFAVYFFTAALVLVLRLFTLRRL